MGRVLIGRDAELERLTRFLHAGTGGSAWVSGPSGIGKSALLRGGAVVAGHAGHQVLEGRCDPGTGDVPFWPWLEVLRSRALLVGREEFATELADAAPVLARVMPDLRLLLPDVAPAAQVSRFAVWAAVRGWLSRLGSRSPALLVLDDLQEADRDSLQLLLAVLHDLPALPVRVLGSHSEPSPPGTADLLSRMDREGDRLVLGPLPAPDVIRLARLTAARELTSGQLEQVVALSEGHPMFVVELAAWLAAGPREDPLPPNLRALAADRLSTLTGDGRRVLAALAVLGAPAPIGLLARVVDQPVTPVAELLDPALRQGLVRQPRTGVVAFTHRLFLDVILADLPLVDRARLHLAAATVLEQQEPATDPAALAAHRLHAAVLDPDGALDAALVAARSATARAAPAQAAAQYERALDLLAAGGSPGPEVAEVQLHLAQARWASGDLTAADAAAWSAAECTPDVQVRAQAALTLGGGIVVTGPPDPRHLALLDDVLRTLEGHDAETDALRSRLLARRGQLECFRAEPGAPERGTALCRRALELSERTGDDRALAVALFMLHFTLDDPRWLEERLQLSQRFLDVAHRLADAEWQVHALLFRAIDLLGAGRSAEMRRVLDEHAPLAARLQHPLFVAAGQTTRSSLALAEGRLDDAEIWAQSAMRTLGDFPDPQFQLLALSHLFEVSRCRGRPEQHRVEIADLAQTRHPVALALHARASTACGNLAAAEPVLRALAVDDFAPLPAWPATAVTALLVDVVIAVGDRRLARHLRERLAGTDRLLVTGGRPTLAPGGLGGAHLAKLARLEGDLEAAIALGRGTVGAQATLSSPAWAAEAMTELATALRQRGRPDDHREAGHLERSAARLRAETPLATPPPQPAGGVVVMHRRGPDWEIVYAGRLTAARDSSGLQVLARLVAEPGREFHVLDLVTAVAPVRSSGREPDPLRGQEGGLGPLVDARALRAYRQRLAELDDIEHEAQQHHDDERGAQARREREFLLEQVRTATGLGGRRRAAGSPAERARSSVTQALRRSLRRLGEADDVLGTHLRRSVTTGTYVSYRP